MKRFLNLIVYILSVHLSALIITGLFRGVLFISASADGSCSLWALQLLREGFIPFLHYLLRCLLWVGLSDQCG